MLPLSYLETLGPEAPKMGIDPFGACILPVLDDAFVSQLFRIGASTAYLLLRFHLGLRFGFPRVLVTIRYPCPWRAPGDLHLKFHVGVPGFYLWQPTKRSLAIPSNQTLNSYNSSSSSYTEPLSSVPRLFRNRNSYLENFPLTHVALQIFLVGI